MSYRRTPSPLLTGVLVGVGVWVVGYLAALILVVTTRPPATEYFSLPGYAGAIYVFGAVLALLSLAGESTPLLLLSPAFVVLLVAVAGGAIVPVIVITVTIYRYDRTTSCGRPGTDLQ